MPAPQPQLIPKAFAQDADPAHRNTIPAAPVTTQRASFNLGFPPLTMTPVVAGGKPMLGPDMNGILYMLSSHAYYQQSGQPYRWNADVAVAIAGYAAGTILGSTDGVTLWFNLTAGNATDPDAGGAGWVPMYSYGVTLLPPANGGVVVLTAAQATKPVIVISGALIANLQVVVPNSLRRWLIVNTCTGGFTVTVKTAAGLGVAIPAGGYGGPTEVYGDGTNIYNVVAPVSLPIDVAPTPNTIVQRSNNGYVYATYFNQSGGVENFGITEVFAGAGDGFLRKINKANFALNFALNTFAGSVDPTQVPVGAVNQYRGTILNDSVLTGDARAPTPAAGDNSTKIATTAFVQGASSIAGNGYMQFPNGIIFQWGYAAGAVGPGTIAVVFPTPFPNNAFAGYCCTANRTAITGNGSGYVSGLGLAGMTIAVDQPNAGGPRQGFWFAVGN